MSMENTQGYNALSRTMSVLTYRILRHSLLERGRGVRLLLLGLWCASLAHAEVKYNIHQLSGWWWTAPEVPEIEVCVENTGKEAVTARLTLEVETDTHVAYQSFCQQVKVGAKDSTTVTFFFNCAPGFYTCYLKGDDQPVDTFNIGFEPENIVSLPDAQPDFGQFWDYALHELSLVEPKFEMKEEADKSNKTGKVYLVKMRSLGNEEIQGYLTIPNKASVENKFPVLVHYMGYGSEPWYPHPDSNPDMIEFVLSTRGQALNKPNNKYGDWIVSGFGNKDEYYYRGAFMDCIRALDFIEQLPEADTDNIFAEGGSQGGAFTYAACALDPKKRIRAAAPWIPFLSDFPDYFKIVSWPAVPLQTEQKKWWMSDKDFYAFLSYFDIKNHARNVTCPILMGIGLQDPVCPPHTNFSGYNLLRVPKSFVIYTNCQHDTLHPDWDKRQKEFFWQNMKKNTHK